MYDCLPRSLEYSILILMRKEYFIEGIYNYKNAEVSNIKFDGQIAWSKQNDINGGSIRKGSTRLNLAISDFSDGINL